MVGFTIMIVVNNFLLSKIVLDVFKLYLREKKVKGGTFETTLDDGDDFIHSEWWLNEYACSNLGINIFFNSVYYVGFLV